MKRNIIGYIGNQLHLADHLVPFCQEHSIPLLCDEDLVNAIENLYPGVTLIGKNLGLLDPGEIAQSYKVLLASSLTTIYEISLQLEYIYGLDITTIYLPHGNSDKGFYKEEAALFEKLDICLVYGEHMKQNLMKRHLLDKVVTCPIGNPRLKYFETHKTFYEKLFGSLFEQSEKDKITALYAPTYNDENLSSFFTYTESLVDTLPINYQLLIKPHPYLKREYPDDYQKLVDKIKQSDATFIEQDVPIYFLLSKVDLYLGDFSSIGFDALCFDIPLFFLPSEKIVLDDAKTLRDAGLETPKSNIWEFIDKHFEENKVNFFHQRENIRKQTFGDSSTNLFSLKDLETLSLR